MEVLAVNAQGEERGTPWLVKCVRCLPPPNPPLLPAAPARHSAAVNKAATIAVAWVGGQIATSDMLQFVQK